MSQKAIFLDRDDTLIDDPGYIKSPEQLKLLPGVVEALTQLQKMDYLLVIVTNQSGIARGYIDESQLDEIHQRLKSMLFSQGVRIDGLYYCPYHPDGVVKDYSMESNLRKPDSGMLEKAAEELEIDLDRSWMIGDSYRDIKAGQKAGCQTILVDVPGKSREKQPEDPDPDRKAVNLREAVNIVRMYEFHQKARAAQKQKEQKEQRIKSVTASKASRKEVSTPEKSPVETAVASPVEAPVKPTAPAAAAEKKTPAAKPAPAPAAPAETPPPAQPVKLHTTKRVVTPEKPIEPQTETEPHPDKAHHMLEEILHRLKAHNRTDLYDDFSVFKLMATLTQVIALACMAVSLVFWLSPKYDNSFVQNMTGYAITLQLLVIALLMMHKSNN